MTSGPSICAFCARNHGKSVISGRDVDKDGEVVKVDPIPGVPDGFETGVCAAFPQGIPFDIFVGGFDHRHPYGDETILFERKPHISEDRVDQLMEWARQLDDD